MSSACPSQAEEAITATVGAAGFGQAEEDIMAMAWANGINQKKQVRWEDFHSLLRDQEMALEVTQLSVRDDVQVSYGQTLVILGLEET